MDTIETLPMYLFRRGNGGLYFRRPVPKDLQPFLNGGNRKEIMISLRSKALTEQVREAHHQYHMDSERLLEEARLRKTAAASGNITPKTRPPKEAPKDSIKRRAAHEFSEGELRTIGQRWYSTERAETVEQALVVFNFGDADERHLALEDNKKRLDSLQRVSGAAFSHQVPALLRELVEKAGGFLSHLPPYPEFMKVASLEMSLRQGLIELALLEKEILTTGLAPKLEPTLTTLVSSETPVQTVKAPATITLDELITRFDGDFDRENLQPKTRDEAKLVFGILRELLGGATPVGEITRDQLKNLRMICLELPAHYKISYKGKSLQEIPALAKADGKLPMMKSTFNKRMTVISGLFNYAVKEQIISSSPALGLTVEVPPKEDGSSTYNLEDLNKFFSGPLYQSFSEKPERMIPGDQCKPHTFWAPLIAV